MQLPLPDHDSPLSLCRGIAAKIAAPPADISAFDGGAIGQGQGRRCAPGGAGLRGAEGAEAGVVAPEGAARYPGGSKARRRSAARCRGNQGTERLVRRTGASLVLAGLAPTALRTRAALVAGNAPSAANGLPFLTGRAPGLLLAPLALLGVRPRSESSAEQEPKAWYESQAATAGDQTMQLSRERIEWRIIHSGASLVQVRAPALRHLGQHLGTHPTLAAAKDASHAVNVGEAVLFPRKADPGRDA